MTSGDENWVIFAKWTLGEITDHEYADHLEARGDGDDPAARVIIDRLRSGEPSARYTDVRPPGWTPADAQVLGRPADPHDKEVSPCDNHSPPASSSSS